MPTNTFKLNHRKQAYPSVPCVYAIVNVLTGDLYVGATNDMQARISGHLGKLSANDHPSKVMQAAFNDIGSDAFEVRVLESCEFADVFVCERKWMEKLRPVMNAQSFSPAPQKTPAYLGAGVKGTNLIRRTRDGIEIAPEYVPNFRQPPASALKQAAKQCAASGFKSFHYGGDSFLVSRCLAESVEPVAA